MYQRRSQRQSLCRACGCISQLLVEVLNASRDVPAMLDAG